MRITYVEGVSPAKWLRVWAERRPDRPLAAARAAEGEQFDPLDAGEAEMAFVRLTGAVPESRTGLHTIPLWEEQAVAVLPRDHALAEAAKLELAELAGEQRVPDGHDARTSVELVAAGTGYVILPQGVARLFARRDVAAVPVTDATPTRIALVWPVAGDDDDTQELAGIVRGRTARSSRGPEQPEQPKPARTPRPAQPKRKTPPRGRRPQRKGRR